MTRIRDDDLEGLIDLAFSMTVAELKENLKSYGLPVSGKANDLRARLAFQWSFYGDRWARQNKPMGVSEYDFYMSLVSQTPQTINYWQLKI